MSRSLIPMSLLALALALPSIARAENNPDEGPIFCDVMAAFGAIVARVGGGHDSTSASSEEEYGCPKSLRPVLPSNPPSTTPRERPVPGEALR
jgi:hypothetical protein